MTASCLHLSFIHLSKGSAGFPLLKKNKPQFRNLSVCVHKTHQIFCIVLEDTLTLHLSLRLIEDTKRKKLNKKKKKHVRCSQSVSLSFCLSVWHLSYALRINDSISSAVSAHASERPQKMCALQRSIFHTRIHPELDLQIKQSCFILVALNWERTQGSKLQKFTFHTLALKVGHQMEFKCLCRALSVSHGWWW